MKKTVSISMAALLAACAHAPAPVVAPTPAAIPRPSRGATTSSVTTAGDTTARPEPVKAPPTTTVDSDKVSDSEVSKRATEVFGDSGTAPELALSNAVNSLATLLVFTQNSGRPGSFKLLATRQDNIEVK